MKMYLFLAVLVYKCSDHFSCAEYELADGNQAENDPAISALDYSNSPENLASGGGDYANSNNNGLVFEFRRSIKSDNTEIEARRRSALDKNFMRFGRADRGFLRFGRLSGGDGEGVDEDGVPYSLVHFTSVNSQLGGEPEDVDPATSAGDSEEEGGSPSLAKRMPVSPEQIEMGDSGEQQVKPKPYVYYRRDAPKNLMRFGKREPQPHQDNFLRLDRANLMRFGRAGTGNAPRGNLLRFGRDNGNLMRFGRANGNLMRFGRGSGNLMRFGRPDPRFVRLVKMDNNFMRFGRSDKSLKPTFNANGTNPETIYK